MRLDRCKLTVDFWTGGFRLEMVSIKLRNRKDETYVTSHTFCQSVNHCRAGIYIGSTVIIPTIQNSRQLEGAWSYSLISSSRSNVQSIQFSETDHLLSHCSLIFANFSVSERQTPELYLISNDLRNSRFYDMLEFGNLDVIAGCVANIVFLRGPENDCT